VAMRYSIVQGPYQSFRNAYSGVLRIFTLQLLQGRGPTLFEDGSQLRDYVNAEDVAGANRLVLERDDANYQVFNVGGGRGYTVREFAEIVRQSMGPAAGSAAPLPAAQITGEYRVGDTRHSVTDIGKLQALGWRPTRTPSESVRAYVDWIRTQRLERDYAGEALTALRRSGALRPATAPPRQG